MDREPARSIAPARCPDSAERETRGDCLSAISGFGKSGIRYRAEKPLEAGRWYRVIAKWNRNREVKLSLRLNNKDPVTGRGKLGTPRAEAWYQVLIGNDRNVSRAGLFLDDVEIWSDFGMEGRPESGDSRNPNQQSTRRHMPACQARRSVK